MRYVIVSVVKGKAGEFNHRLRKELFSKFKARSSKLPPHFTIKAPFEYEGNIDELEEAIEESLRNTKPATYKVNGYNHFDDRVVYMDVDMSKEGKAIHDKLIDSISKIPYIHFTESDGKDKVFHITLASKKIKPIFNDIWNYVNQYDCSYICNFDNVCIYKWINNTWELEKEFKI